MGERSYVVKAAIIRQYCLFSVPLQSSNTEERLLEDFQYHYGKIPEILLHLYFTNLPVPLGRFVLTTVRGLCPLPSNLSG